MTLDDYQTKASRFNVTMRPEGNVMGLLEESGEVAGVFKRMIRGDYNQVEAGLYLVKELGDVLWYLSQVATDNGWNLSDIAQANLDKLESRQIRGKILGAGDDR